MLIVSNEQSALAQLASPTRAFAFRKAARCSCAAERLMLEVRHVGRHVEHTHRVGMAETTLPALDRDNGRAGRDNAQVKRRAQTVSDAVVNLHEQFSKPSSAFIGDTHVGLPLRRINPARLGIPERIAPTVQVNLPRSLLIPGDCGAKKSGRWHSLEWIIRTGDDWA